jgi:hypothetical protein
MLIYNCNILFVFRQVVTVQIYGSKFNNCFIIYLKDYEKDILIRWFPLFFHKYVKNLWWLFASIFRLYILNNGHLNMQRHGQTRRHIILVVLTHSVFF